MSTSEHELPSPGSTTGKDIPQHHRPLLDMFTAVPSHYDFLNRVLTWGFDERWRQQASLECLQSNPRRVLDLCCGTGDLSLHLAKLAKDNVEIIGLDFCEPMLDVAKAKAVTRNLERKVTFLKGDAASLPFPDGYFGALGISFGFRNISYRSPLRQRYLAEMVRVLAPGGRCVIVETSQPRLHLLRDAYHLYLKTVVPVVGGFFSGHRGAYRYLAESARRFYTADEVSNMLLEAGFQRINYRPLLWGISAIHIATR